MSRTPRLNFGKLQNVAHRSVRLDGMAQRCFGVDNVDVSATLPLPSKHAGLFEIRENSGDGSLGDPDRRSEVSHPQTRFFRQGDDYVSVVAQKRPSTLLFHSIATLLLNCSSCNSLLLSFSRAASWRKGCHRTLSATLARPSARQRLRCQGDGGSSGACLSLHYLKCRWSCRGRRPGTATTAIEATPPNQRLRFDVG